jgi:hypothetical protein
VNVPPLHFDLILPDESPPYREVNPWPDDPAESIDDEDERSHTLICLYNACRAFTVYGVRFQIRGFFAEPPPVDTEIDLVWFLDHLPRLLGFLEKPTNTPCAVLLMDQGMETEFHFRGIDNGARVEVSCLSHTTRAMTSNCEIIPLDDLIGQIVRFVENYKEALGRYASHLLQETSNKDLFAAQSRLKYGLKRNS